jgi:hypothetical protein
VLFAAVTAYEWRAGRRFGTTLPRLHLIGVAAGLVLWLMYQRAPGSLPYHPSAARLCDYVGHPGDHACVLKAASARLRSDVTWWSTGVLIAVFALFSRRSRTAAWAAPAIAFAGSALALYFLEAFVRTPGFLF